jgi:hypothetical protein
MGCLKGCLDYLGIGITEAWLYGGTGHAFVLNLHEQVCPSGPTAWKTVRLFELGGNLGYRIEGVVAHKQQDDFAERQRQAWDHARQAIDQGRPCYGWELEIPEYYVVCGYDDDGYYYWCPGCEEGRGPKRWQELGDSGIGVLELYSVSPGEAADDATTVREALTFGIDHAADRDQWTFEHYRAGLAGYDNWIGALQAGTASDMGTRYNTGVWLECRRNAAAFLEEARTRLAGRADCPFEEASARYRAVAEWLGRVAELYPWSFEASDAEMLPVDDTSRAAVEALQAAKEAEADGLKALEAIVAAL